MGHGMKGIQRRQLLGGGMAAAALLANRSAMASALGSSHHHQALSGGCTLCQATSASTLDESFARMPGASPQRSLLMAAAGKRGSAPSGLDTRAGEVVVVQPGWVLVPRGDKLDMLSDYDVVIRGDRIEEVRPRKGGNDKRIDAAGQVLLPGFISAHSHTASGTMTRGWIEENPDFNPAVPHRSFFRAQVLMEELGDEELDDLTALNLAEVIRSGCTTQVEMSQSLHQLKSYVRVITKYGLRGYAGARLPGVRQHGQLNTVEALRNSAQGTLAEVAANLAYGRTVNGSADGRVHIMMAPSSMTYHTAETFAALKAAANELGTGIHIHLQAGFGAASTKLLRDYWNKREIEIVRDVGLLEHRLIGAHCLNFEDPEKDFAILANPNFTFAFCPSALGASRLVGAEPYPEALAAGINTAIGLDGHSNDYLENLKLAVMQGRGRMQLLYKTSPVKMLQPTIWHGLESATRAGARGLGRTDLGVIEAGAKADLCTVDVSGLLVGSGTAPMEPWNNLLYANGLSVRHVMIDGDWKLFDGRIMFDDQERLIARGGAIAKKIWGQMRKESFFTPMPR